ncbi:MAG: hypothetical protein SVR08_16280 [Spirochaetota bacterium]|nr:hypothetical protein [Spirochaetota bacterium]
MVRLGRLKIRKNDLMNTPSKVSHIFWIVKFVPIKINFWDINGIIEYVGVSELFEEIPEYETIPEYSVNVIKEEGKIVSVNCTKIF